MAKHKYKIVIMPIVDSSGHLLMIRRVSDPRDENSGKWEFPVGHLETGESPWVAGPREVKEETGLDVFPLPHGITVPTKAGPAAYFLGFTSLRNHKTRPPVTLADDEHDRYLWIKPKDLHKIKPTHKNMEKNLLDLLFYLTEKLDIDTPPEKLNRVTGNLNIYHNYWKQRLGAKASKPTQVTVYRGMGDHYDKSRRNRVPHQFAVGQYWSTSSDVAGTYGSQVIKKKIQLSKPYILTLGEGPYYEKLRSTFGTLDPQEITDILISQGYDSLIVSNVPVHRFRVDTAEPVNLRNSTEIILFDPLPLNLDISRKRGSLMKRTRTADQGGILPPRFTRRMPGPGQELKEAILVGDEVEIFLRQNATGYETPDPAISGIVERRNRNTLWVHSPEDDMKQTRSISWDDRGDWAFIRVYRGPDQVVTYVNGNPYDPESKEVDKAMGLGLILESEPPARYESVWALMRGETPDLDRTMGQAPQSMDQVAPFRKPKAGTPEILHQVREVLRSYSMEPDVVDGLGMGRVLILTQDSQLKDEIAKVLKKHGKEVKSTRTDGLIIRDRRAQGTTTIPLEKDDDLMLLTLRQKQREKTRREKTRKQAIPQLPVQMPVTPQTNPGAPQLSVTIPNAQQQIQSLQKTYGALQQKPLPGGKGVQVTFSSPQQLMKFQQDQMHPSTAPKSANRSRSEVRILKKCAHGLRDALRREDYRTATTLLETLLNRGVKEQSIIRAPLARKSTWDHFSRYLAGAGEIRSSRVASAAARVSRD